MLLGSSITGRLPDRTQGFTGFANLGCDGGSAADTLRAMDRGDLPVAPLLIVEGNTLIPSLAAEGSAINRAIRSPMFRIGTSSVPALGATARPSAFLYSALLAGKIGTTGGPEGDPLPTFNVPHEVSSPPALSQEEQALTTELSAIIGRLRKRGSHVLIAMYPKDPGSTAPASRIAPAVAHDANIMFLDLATGLPEKSFTLTDGVHMAPDSAAATVRSLVSALVPAENR